MQNGVSNGSTNCRQNGRRLTPSRLTRKHESICEFALKLLILFTLPLFQSSNGSGKVCLTTSARAGHWQCLRSGSHGRREKVLGKPAGSRSSRWVLPHSTCPNPRQKS